MRSHRTSAIAVAVAVVASIAAGCGGEDDSSSASTDSSAIVVTTIAEPDSAANSLSTSAAADTTAVEIAAFAFTPQMLTVAAGTTVTWTNADGFDHAIGSKDASLSSQNLRTGDSFSHTFAVAGTFAYVCSIHNSMTGTVLVT